MALLGLLTGYNRSIIGSLLFNMAHCRARLWLALGRHKGIKSFTHSMFPLNAANSKAQLLSAFGSDTGIRRCTSSILLRSMASKSSWVLCSMDMARRTVIGQVEMIVSHFALNFRPGGSGFPRAIVHHQKQILENNALASGRFDIMVSPPLWVALNPLVGNRSCLLDVCGTLLFPNVEFDNDSHCIRPTV